MEVQIFWKPDNVEKRRRLGQKSTQRCSKCPSRKGWEREADMK